MRGSLWIAINEQGRGAVGFTEEGVLDALPRSNRVCLGRLSAWALFGAVVRASALPVRFTHRWTSAAAQRERRSW